AFSLAAGPSFAAVATTDAGTGVASGTLTLTPGFADSGSYALSVEASDGFLTTAAPIALTVRNLNRAPVFNIVPMPMVPEGADEEYAVSVVDIDSDALVLRIVSAPTYVTLGISNSNYGFISAVLRFRPGFFDAGMTSVTLGAFDGTVETTQLIDVMIRNVNREPTMTAPETVSAREGEPVAFDAVVEDPDGEFASFSGIGLPDGATFVDGMNNIGRFRWLPRYDQAGDYSVTLRADDGAGGAAERQVAIGVADEDAAIALSQPFDMEMGEGSIQEQTIQALDASGDPVAFTLAAGPAYATVATTDAGTGTAQGVVRLAPGFEDAGEVDVTLRASDGVLTAERTFHVTVLDQPPGPPPDGPPFAPPFQTVLTAQTPHTVTAADVNADGHLDLVVAALGSNMVSVFLAVGDGTFQMRRDYPTAVRPHTVVPRDLNGDGILDLTLSNIGSNSVSTMLGLGDGTFGPRRDFPLGGSPVFAGVGEFDGDGIPDIVSTNQTIGALMFLHGNGDGTFGTAVAFAADAGSHGLAIADLNADGTLDVAIANDVARTASVHLGRGDGTFEPASILRVGEPHTVAIGDANGDGRLDIVTSNYHHGTVTILHGNGDGTFVEGPSFATGVDAHASTLADVDGDGKTDLIVVNQGSGTASFFMGLGGGAFAPKLDYAVGSGAHSIAVADMDKDGGPDVLVSCIFANTVRILKNQRPAPVPAAAWPGPEDRFLVLRAEKPAWTLYAERMEGGGLADAFDPVAIVPGSVRLRSEGTGSISEIAAVEGKGAAITDRDKDGVPEAALHFTRADLRLLFGNLRGRHEVSVEVAGRLEGGQRFLCDAVISVVAAGPPGQDPVTVAPNPLNPAGAVSFSTRTAGPARVTAVDVQGRKVATLLETPMLGAGDHSLALRADRRIASGIYFVRVETSDGVRSARFTLLK
ncbi:MAG TPA: FG-GAP-like repeat-containing protein, partial [Candidatus Eisenbacteria bacterium]|nr:FG-GAP-like repeat-containing protein [Candidatus Eisenbacteria bacterium]